MMFAILCLGGMLGGLLMLVSSWGIVCYLNDHGVEIDYSDFRSRFWAYLPQYRAMTGRNTGRVGIYYYLFYISWGSGIFLLVCVLVFNLKYNI